MTEGEIHMRTVFSHHIPIHLTRDASGHVAGKLSAEPCFFYRHHRLNSLAAFVLGFLFLLVALLSAAPSRAAGLVNLKDAELANVTGQAGISIGLDLSMNYSLPVLKFSDTSAVPNWLEFKNFTISDGSGGPFVVTTYQGGTLAGSDPVTVDVGTNSSGHTLISYYDSSQVSPRWYSAELWFGDAAGPETFLGNLHLDGLSQGPSLAHVGAHADGTGGGLDFDYKTSLSAQALRYTYNSALETLALSGIHLAGAGSAITYNMNGFPLDPSKWTLNDPTAWTYTGNFKIGDIGAGHPAKVDVVTDTTSGITSIYQSLPMQGTLRVANVNFGGNDFGPIAIDGINVQRLTVKMTP
jgi:hypothetical protein